MPWFEPLSENSFFSTTSTADQYFQTLSTAHTATTGNTQAYYTNTTSTTNGVYYVNYPLQYTNTKQELEWRERQRRIERVRQWREQKMIRRHAKVREITLAIALAGITDAEEAEALVDKINNEMGIYDQSW